MLSINKCMNKKEIQMTMCIVFHFLSLICFYLGILNPLQLGQFWFALQKHVKPQVTCLCPTAGHWSKQILELGCLEENEVCRLSHGDAAVELINLPLEEFLQLWPLGL